MAGLQKIRELTIDTMIPRNFSQNGEDLKTYYFYQGDINSAKFLLNITHEGAEQDLSTATKVQIAFLKPDGKRVFQDCSNVNPTKGKYYVVLNTQSITTVGNIVAQIRITFPDTVVETTKFVFSVAESIMSDEAVESSDEFPAIQKAIEAGEKLEGKDIDGIIAAGAKADAALVEVNKNKDQIGILSENTTTNTNKIAELNKKVGEGNAITLKTAAARNSNIVCIGDSITAGQGGTRNYPFFLDATLQGLNIKNVGVGGVKIAYHITNSAAYLNLNPRPNIAIVLIGTNDLNVPSVLNQMKTDYKELIAILTTNNITPVLCTLLPRTDNSATTSDLLKFNEFIREFARMMGFTLIDTYEVVANKDGSPKLGYLSADNLHPTTYGYQYIAEAIAKGLPLTYKNVEWNVPTTSNIILNPAFTTDANSDGRADNWSNFSSSGVTATYTLSDHPIEGKWQQISKTGGVDANSSTYLYQLITLPAGIVPGDTVLFSVDVETDEITVGDVEVAGQWLTSADAFISSITPLNRTGTQIRAKRFKIRQVIPASATKIKVLLTVYGNGTTVARFGRVLIKRIETI